MKLFKYMFLVDIHVRKYTQVSYWTRCVSLVVVNYSYRGIEGTITETFRVESVFVLKL